ncbi:MAG: phenylalanine--tRNA ligase subunit alpha, partial [Bacillota bacterium]|nr:phenylalanine--tRNA ligase subunit alpha [Bacillota bacterium]
MDEDLALLEKEALEEVAAAQTEEELEEVRVRWLGRKGRLTGVLRRLADLPASQRKAMGQKANDLKRLLEGELETRRQEVKRQREREQMAREGVDVSLPGIPLRLGHRHPLLSVLEEIEAIFGGLGFEVAHGPEVETDLYNFALLNIPESHPARDMQDTFYVEEGRYLLRTQTSPVQVRFMQARAPRLPVRMIAPGRVYRRDDDATHSPMFHQVEGLVVDEGIHFGHLRWTLEEFARRMLGAKTQIRLRPSYFPFTEPSAEVDATCSVCSGRGCSTCKGTGWLEILGAGMVHPVVLQNGG